MKSIKFTVQEIKEKLYSGEKKTTIRTLYLPKYIPGEEVFIYWQEDGFLNLVYHAIIDDVIPIKFNDITEEIAVNDGFNNLKECKDWLLKRYRLKPDNWLFLTKFHRKEN